ncbi:MAG: nuclear transport factor 2 family protein [Proteobacteria bacterium]|nr:nuclear transport factor 2 family protein [Pseudomonadota bacterium]
MSPETPAATLEQRIARLEARAEIRELVGRYCLAVDERDLAGIAECFAHEGIMRSLDGVMNAHGRAEVIEQFHGRFAVLGPSNHYTHDHLIWFDPAAADRARGLLNTHAEVVRNGEFLVASLRYHDRYCLEDGRWRFAERALAFFYYARPGDLAGVMASPLRNRAYPEPVAADFPERSPHWVAYHRERPQRR